jgi:hypothetical protein
VVQSLREIANRQGLPLTIWALSAGLGLVPDTTKAPAYSATFAPGLPDSVVRERSNVTAGNQQWWRAIYGLESATEKVPFGTRDIVICIASPLYLSAAEPTIGSIASYLAKSNQLLIVTSASTRSILGSVRQHVVVTSALMQDRLGGSRISLNARAARWLLNHGYIGRDQRVAQKCLDRLSAPLPQRSAAKRLTDEAIIGEIGELLVNQNELSRTHALRKLRDSGVACEQKRFERLFKKVHSSRREEIAARR